MWEGRAELTLSERRIWWDITRADKLPCIVWCHLQRSQQLRGLLVMISSTSRTGSLWCDFVNWLIIFNDYHSSVFSWILQVIARFECSDLLNVNFFKLRFYGIFMKFILWLLSWDERLFFFIWLLAFLCFYLFHIEALRLSLRPNALDLLPPIVKPCTDIVLLIGYLCLIEPRKHFLGGC